MIFRSLLVLSIFALAGAIFNGASKQDAALDPAAVKQATASSVIIKVMENGVKRTWCSGIVVSRQHILTANHCTPKEGLTYKVFFHSGDLRQASVTWKGSESIGFGKSDWAVLRLNSLVAERQVSPLADSVPAVGARVFYVGHPREAAWMLHVGYWAQTHTEADLKGVMPATSRRMPAVDVSSASGASGTGIYNERGEVVAVLTAVQSYSGPMRGGGGVGGRTLVVPIPAVRETLADVLPPALGG